MLASVRRRPTFFSALSSENLPLCSLTNDPCLYGLHHVIPLQAVDHAFNDYITA